MSKQLDLYDTSNFPKTHPLYSAKNCKVLGKMKDECAAKVVEEFVGLKPKMYSMLYGYEKVIKDGDGKEKIKQMQGTIRKVKGVKKSVVEKHIKHQLYVDCLAKHSSFKHPMNLIRSFNHQLYSITVTKTSLSPYDDKRYVLESGIDTLPHGHHMIKS